MALYQPSFCIPKNQAIDATDENDMTFIGFVAFLDPVKIHNEEFAKTPKKSIKRYLYKDVL